MVHDRMEQRLYFKEFQENHCPAQNLSAERIAVTCALTGKAQQLCGMKMS